MAKLAVGIFILTYISIVKGAIKSIEVSDGNFTLIQVNTPTIIPLPGNNVTTVLRVGGIAPTTAYILFQVHAHVTNVTVSLSSANERGYVAKGVDIGVVAMIPVGVYFTDFYVTPDVGAEVLVMAHAYGANHPVAGGCNMEFSLKLDPNLLLKVDPNTVAVEFQYSNLGVPRGIRPPPCEEAALQKRLSYDIYQLFLPGRDWSQSTYLNTLADLLRVDELMLQATHVKRIEYHHGRTLVKFAAYPGQGMLFGVVVQEQTPDNQTTRALYVPVVTYTCTFVAGQGCIDIDDLPMQILACILAAFGLVLCVGGHRYFKFSMFTFGMLSFGMIGYILLARFTPFVYSTVLIAAGACGLVGGILWLLLWCLLGVPVISVLLPGLVMGFVFSSVAFNLTPLGLLDVFTSDFNYGMSFACGVLILPVILLVFTKKLSLLSCTVVGAFLMTAAADSFLHSGVAYIVLNAIRKGSIPGYTTTLVTMPLQLTGILLLAGWGVLVLLGLIFQSYTERDKPDFSACPYDRFRERQQRRRQMQELASARDMNTEREPLLRGRTRPRVYGRSNMPQFQETPPEQGSPQRPYNGLVDPL